VAVCAELRCAESSQTDGQTHRRTDRHRPSFHLPHPMEVGDITMDITLLDGSCKVFCQFLLVDLISYAHFSSLTVICEFSVLFICCMGFVLTVVVYVCMHVCFFVFCCHFS